MDDDVRQVLKDLLRLPKQTAFIKLGYLTFVKPNRTVEFMNGLLVLAIEAREADDWRGVEAYLDEWERVVEAYTQGAWYEAQVEGRHFAALRVPLREATVGLITTGGLHLASQPPFDLDGDHSYREIRLEALPGPYGVAHDKYDTRGALEDYNCIFPIDRLREAAAEGRIGRVAPMNYGFMGYIPDWQALVRDTAPEVARRMRDAGVDAVVVGTT